jgi:DNA-binding IclR family transcriptional regulator
LSLLRVLDPRQRRLLVLYRGRVTASNAEIAAHLGLSTRTVAALTRDWVEEGFLELDDPSRRSRRYRLASEFDSLARR